MILIHLKARVSGTKSTCKMCTWGKM